MAGSVFFVLVDAAVAQYGHARLPVTSTACSERRNACTALRSRCTSTLHVTQCLMRHSLMRTHGRHHERVGVRLEAALAHEARAVLVDRLCAAMLDAHLVRRRHLLAVGAVGVITRAVHRHAPLLASSARLRKNGTSMPLTAPHLPLPR